MFVYIEFRMAYHVQVEVNFYISQMNLKSFHVSCKTECLWLEIELQDKVIAVVEPLFPD